MLALGRCRAHLTLRCPAAFRRRARPSANGEAPSRPPTPFLLRWDGDRWRTIALAIPGWPVLTSVSCPDVTCLILGANYGRRYTPIRRATHRRAAQRHLGDRSHFTSAFTSPQTGSSPYWSASCRPTFCMIVGNHNHLVQTERYDFPTGGPQTSTDHVSSIRSSLDDGTSSESRTCAGNRWWRSTVWGVLGNDPELLER
jgi:hypothetical protein